MPRVLEDAVLEIDARLAVVRARDDVDGAVHAAGIVLELGEVDRRQVAEGAVAQQDFRAGIHAGEPRRAVERGRAVDEAGLRAARGEHEVEDAAQFGAGGLVVEDEGVVGHAALGLALAPVVLLADGELLPFGGAVFEQADFRRAARAEDRAQPVADVVDVHLAQELARAAVHDLGDRPVGHGDRFVALADPAVARQARARGADFREIEHELVGGVLAGEQLADGLGPGLGGIADADGPDLGFGIPGFEVAFAAVLVLARGADDLDVEDGLGEAADAAGFRRDAHAAALQQQPERVHHVVHGLDFQVGAVELAGLADFRDFGAAEPQRAAGHADLAGEQQAAELFELVFLRLVERAAHLALPQPALVLDDAVHGLRPGLEDGAFVVEHAVVGAAGEDLGAQRRLVGFRHGLLRKNAVQNSGRF